jgi:signal transduction histidine kinase
MPRYSQSLIAGLIAVGMVPLLIALLLGHYYVDKSHTLSQHPSAHNSTRSTTQPEPKRQALKRSYVWASISLAVGALLLALLVAFLLFHSQAQTLFQMRHAIRAAAPEAFVDDTSQSAAPQDALGALANDVSQLLAHVEDVQQQEVFKEQVSRWQDVARRLAHEVRNPLTPILLSVQELQKRYTGDDQRYAKQLNDTLEIVRDEVDTLRRLVEEFSSFAKLPQTQPSREELNQNVTDFLDAYQWFREHIPVTFESHQTEIWVALDRMLFRRVLHNLVQNAIEAHSPSVHIRLGVLPNEQVICQIEDRGPGIPEHLQSKIFTPYFTTKQFGTGLGLSITKKIIIDHRGTIGVAPHPAGGSVFTIRLPQLAPTFEETFL